MRAKNPICPRCGTREKEPGRAYCCECHREYDKEAWRRYSAWLRLKKKRAELWAALQKEAAGCREILAKVKGSGR